MTSFLVPSIPLPPPFFSFSHSTCRPQAVQYTKAILLTSCNLDQSRAMDDRSFVLQETSENFTTTLSASSSAERDKWLSALEGSFVVCLVFLFFPSPVRGS